MGKPNAEYGLSGLYMMKEHPMHREKSDPATWESWEKWEGHSSPWSDDTAMIGCKLSQQQITRFLLLHREPVLALVEEEEIRNSALLTQDTCDALVSLSTSGRNICQPAAPPSAMSVPWADEF